MRVLRGILFFYLFFFLLINYSYGDPYHPLVDNLLSTPQPYVYNNVNVDVPENSGAATYSIPIEVPPAREGLVPKLYFTYSSHASNSWLGVGWNIEGFGYIVRSTRKGVPEYSSNDVFEYKIMGESGELVPEDATTPVEYRAKRQQKFIRFKRDATDRSKWYAWDRDGNEYLLGTTGYVQSSDGSNSGNKYKFFLKQVTSTNGNAISFSYIIDTDNGNELNFYPSTIDYNQLGSNYYHISFHYESRNDGVDTITDDIIDFKSGFKIKTRRRLQYIDIMSFDSGQNPPWTRARQYNLTYYSKTNDNPFSRLKNIKLVASDGNSVLRTYTFTYSDSTESFDSPSIDWDWGQTPPPRNSVRDPMNGYYAPSQGYWGQVQWNVVDMNGDGVADFVDTYADGNNTVHWEIYKGFLSGSSGGFTSQAETWTGLSETNGIPVFIATPSVDPGNTDSWTFWVDLIDMNGDGLPDIVKSNRNSFFKVKYNTGSGFESLSPSWTYSTDEPHREIDSNGNLIKTIIDINGDGFPDYIKSTPSDNDNWQVALNKGKDQEGFKSAVPWAVPGLSQSAVDAISVIDTTDTNNQFITQALIDMNGDGLPDYVKVGSGDAAEWKVRFNKGDGFTSSHTWTAPKNSSGNSIQKITDLRDSDGGKAYFDVFDINGDGLPDYVKASSGDTDWKVYLNNGTGFNESISWAARHDHIRKVHTVSYEFPNGTEHDVLDINGDGLVDFVDGVGWYVNLNNTKSNLLVKVENGLGGYTDITYKNATKLNDYSLPFNIYVVKQLETYDGLGSSWPNKYTTNYDYSSAFFDLDRKEFPGFAWIEESFSGGDKVISKNYYTYSSGTNNDYFYHMPLDVSYFNEVPNSNYDNYEKKIDFVYAIQDTMGFESLEAKIPYIKKKTINTKDGTSLLKTKYINTVDKNGNLTKERYLGFYNGGSDSEIYRNDEQDTVYTYSLDNTTNPTINKLATKTVYWGFSGGTIISKEQFYYDGLSLGSISNGNLTKHSVWDNRTDTFLNTTYAYYTNGNLYTIEDPRSNKNSSGKKTTYIYDTTFETYPIEVENPKGLAASYTWDYTFGKKISSTDLYDVNDPNYPGINTTYYYYDIFGRLEGVIRPIHDTQSTYDISYAYSSLGTAPYYIKTTLSGDDDTENTNDGLNSVTFYDGLGREIEQKVEGSSSTNDVKFYRTYTRDNNVDKEYNPFNVTSSILSYDDPNSNQTTEAFTNYNYDVLGRLIKQNNPIKEGETVQLHETIEYALDTSNIRYKKTLTKKDSSETTLQTKYEYTDAYDRRVKEENCCGSEYTEYAYSYLSNGDLQVEKKFAGNNATSIINTFDSVGRLRSTKDPDRNNSGGTGQFIYTYDENGNLTNTTTPAERSVTNTYDDLNRLTSKTVLKSGGSDTWAYQWDTSSSQISGSTTSGYSIGKLCDTYLNGYLKTHYVYDERGRTTEVYRKADISSKTYQYYYKIEYDHLDRESRIYYPDFDAYLSYVGYGYGANGLIKTISEVDMGRSRDIVHVDDIIYNAAGQITGISYNGPDRSIPGNPPQLLNLPARLFEYDERTLQLKQQDVGGTNVQLITYDYDELNRLETVARTSGNSPYTSTYTYDGMNRLTQATLPSGTASYAYDSIGNMTTHNNITFPSTDFISPHRPGKYQYNSTSYNLGYDDDGNMVSKVNTFNQTLEYVYDGEGRLSTVKRNGVEVNYYVYDSFGFRDSKMTVDATAPSEYVAYFDRYFEIHEQESYASGKSGWMNKFIWAGNVLIAVVEIDKPGNNFTISTSSSSGTGCFTQPFNKPSDPTIYYYIFAGLLLIITLDELKRQNVFKQKPGFKFAVLTVVAIFAIETVPFAVNKAEADGAYTPHIQFTHTTYYYMTDNHGGTYRVIRRRYSFDTNGNTLVAAGEVLAETTYKPYGDLETGAYSSDAVRNFEGKERQRSTSGTPAIALYYFGGRFYDAQLGMFIQPDPAMEFPSPYLYTGGDPINRTDPSGFCTGDDLDCTEITDTNQIAAFMRALLTYFSSQQGGASSNSNTREVFRFYPDGSDFRVFGDYQTYNHLPQLMKEKVGEERRKERDRLFNTERRGWNSNVSIQEIRTEVDFNVEKGEYLRLGNTSYQYVEVTQVFEVKTTIRILDEASHSIITVPLPVKYEFNTFIINVPLIYYYYQRNYEYH